MDSGSRLVQLIECLVQVIGRTAMPLEKVQEIVDHGSAQVKAFNLCDGANSQTEIAKAAGLDQGSLSKSFKRWVQNGVAFGVGEGGDAHLLHIYPLPKPSGRKAKGKRKGLRK